MKPQKCVYCRNNIANTVDHIPPKCIFPKPLPSNLITVPCCKECNEKFSLDDEYFMVFLTLIEDTKRNEYKDKLFEKLQRMKLRKESASFLSDIKNSYESRIRISKNGLILLNQPGLNINQTRIKKTVDRIIAGLVYKEIGCYAVDVISVFTVDYNKLTYEMEKDLFGVLDFLKDSKINKIGDGRIFSYKVSYPKNCPELSAWILNFFETYYVVALARHDNFTGKYHTQGK